MVNKGEGNMRSHVFWVWGGLCACILLYAYMLVPETKVRPPNHVPYLRCRRAMLTQHIPPRAYPSSRLIR